MNIKKAVYLFLTITIMFLAVNFSAFAAEKINISTFGSCEKIYCDASDSGVFAFGYNGKTIYTQSFVPSLKTYSFTAEGSFVGVPKLDKETVSAVYMTDDFKYKILRINCLSGEVSNIKTNALDDFNYNHISVCNGRFYVLKTDELYSYIASYDFDGEHLFDYRFSEKNVNEITVNNGFTYALLYDGSVYRLDDDKVEYCNRVRDSSDFYNCGVGFLADSNGYIYSLTENTEYTDMYNRTNPFTVNSENIYYINANSVICFSFNGDSITEYGSVNGFTGIYNACEKIVVISENFDMAAILSDSDFKNKNTDNNPDYNLHTDPTQNSNTNSTDAANVGNNDYIFTNDGYICNIKSGTTVAQLKKSCPQIISVTDKNGNKLSGKLKTGAVIATKEQNYVVAVIGDVTGTGEVNSKDCKCIMQYLTGKNELFGAYKKAADYNLDGSVDNKDLVLIARKN